MTKFSTFEEVYDLEFLPRYKPQFCEIEYEVPPLFSTFLDEPTKPIEIITLPEADCKNKKLIVFVKKTEFYSFKGVQHDVHDFLVRFQIF